MVGRTISHYKILERLGKGGMGEVWKAEDTHLRRIVALKFLSSDAIDDRERSLDHPNNSPFYGIHEADGETLIAMPTSTRRRSSTRSSNARCRRT